MTGGLPWMYEVHDASQEDQWSSNFAAAPFKDKALDCSGKDSGKSACWPLSVNVAVPIACCAVFIVVLVILHAISRKPKTIPDSGISSSTTVNMPRKAEPSYQNTGLSTDTLTTPSEAHRPKMLDSVSLQVQHDPSLTTQL